MNAEHPEPAVVPDGPSAEPERRSFNPVGPVVVLVLLVAASLAAVSTLGSNANSTFSFVGSSIRPPAGGGGGGGGTGGGEENPKEPPAAPPVERKIVYNCSLELKVADLDAATAAVESLVGAHKGYVAKSELSTGADGRTAAFTLRAPVDRFRPLVAELARLGTPGRNTLDSQDVTEEFVDVEARIKNLQQEEEALNRLLKDKAGSVDEVLTIRRQIQPVRESIDRLEARRKYLLAVSALATIELTLRQPAAPVAAPAVAEKPRPTFGERAGTTFGGSWGAFVSTSEGVGLFVVALAAWTPVLVPLGLLGGVAVWQRVRRSRATPPA